MRKRLMTGAAACAGLIGVAMAAAWNGTVPDKVTSGKVLVSLSDTERAPSFARTVAAQQAAASTSDWAKIVNGKLTYRTTDKGDRIMDFSTAGFGGGGVALPTDLPVRVTLTPTGGDDTNAIQAAIDNVSARSLGSDGYRGVVRLGPGTFRISRTLLIKATGVVVAGSGSASGGTEVALTGSTGFLAFQFGESQEPTFSNKVDLTSSYIKSGSSAVRVSSIEGLAVGQRVMISRKVTADWIRFMGMDKLVRDGQPQTWLAPGETIDTPRAITAIDASTNTVRLDSPITDSFDATYLGSPVGTLSRVTHVGQISGVGLERLRIVAPSGTVRYSAVTMSNVVNGFVSDVVGQETQNAFNVSRDARQITFDRVVNDISVSQTAGAPTGDFSVTGSQVLLNKCASRSNGTWAFVTGARGVGPTVLLNFTTTNSVGIGPHQRWYTGVLVDTANLPNATSARPGIAFTNRGTAGSGHGWTTGWSVAWNVKSPYFKVQAAPGTTNWCIGCSGQDATPAPTGTFDAQNVQVDPPSLYLQQLKERKGVSALNAIGYASTAP